MRYIGAPNQGFKLYPADIIVKSHKSIFIPEEREDFFSLQCFRLSYTIIQPLVLRIGYMDARKHKRSEQLNQNYSPDIHGSARFNLMISMI